MKKRLCKKDKFPSHKEASEIFKQLRVNPEVCENCKIKPCIFGLYLWGTKKQILEISSKSAIIEVERKKI